MVESSSTGNNNKSNVFSLNVKNFCSEKKIDVASSFVGKCVKMYKNVSLFIIKEEIIDSRRLKSYL